uniref:SEA domain-containing protein n=1 Tax=Steinernema glaseri TaxID=37863 RepID=A0A1I7ZU40_9BILA
MRRIADRAKNFFSPNSPSNGSAGPSDFASTANLVESTSNSRTGTVSNDYTELMGGSVPCPSCKGCGRIPKEMEETLVALIPVNDDRLKPKRTWIWVLCGISICVLLAAIAIFMLMPRTVQLSSHSDPIMTVNVTNAINDKDPKKAKIEFNFMNSINISNANYYSVTVTNVTSQIVNQFQPFLTDIIGTGGNDTVITIAPLTSHYNNLLFFNNSVELHEYAAQYCQSPYASLTSLYVTMRFEISVLIEYLGHTEQASIKTTQQVCCIPTGNCTTY